MPNTENLLGEDDDPGLDGPDYVALVVEWDEIASDLERQIHGDEPEQATSSEGAARGERARLAQAVVPKRRARALGIVAGAIGMIALAYFIHRLRA